jgi:hypothetical protein
VSPELGWTVRGMERPGRNGRRGWSYIELVRIHVEGFDFMLFCHVPCVQLSTMQHDLGIAVLLFVTRARG